jgi:eukaryotic-like serine/threonine-protein kinase
VLVNIQLKNKWAYDDDRPLGDEGGFGKVFLGNSADGKPVAIKRIHADQQQVSRRELDIAAYLLGHNHPHVIPILDAGRDGISGNNFIVMAQADGSLQDLVDRSAPLPEADALAIIDAIAGGLLEIGEFVHRDLKPANVLLHNGVWKICDLGLARYVEDATSAQTMKGYLSWAYAAPEQWKFEHAMKATDVYALGCIIYALMNGRPPFSGASEADYSKMHRFADPPLLDASERLRALASSCLLKVQAGRPELPSIRAQVRRAREALGSATVSSLASVGAALAEEKVRTEGLRALEAKTAEDRQALIAGAFKEVRVILQRLAERIRAEAPTSTIEPADNEGVTMISCDIRLGKAALRAWVYPRLSTYMVEETAKAGWTVLGGVLIWIQTRDFANVSSKKISANLWYGKLNDAAPYRWWEASYTRGDPPQEPEGLDHWNEAPNPRLAGPAQLIDGEHVDDFLDRWGDLLAKAAT